MHAARLNLGMVLHTQASLLPLSLTELLASCHGLAKMGDTLVGDPLDQVGGGTRHGPDETHSGHIMTDVEQHPDEQCRMPASIDPFCIWLKPYLLCSTNYVL